MNKATFERALKVAASGKPLKEIRVINKNGVTFGILSIFYDSEADAIFIKIS